MAVNKVIYGGNTLVDLTGDTVTAADLADGVKATGADGNPIVGIMQKVTIDAELSTTSTNPVQNKVIKVALDGKLGKNDTAVNASKVNNLTVETAVPKNAKFTDTVYTHPSTHPASMITGLSTVATSGSYNDLSDKPTIPSAYTLPKATSSTLGGVEIGSNISVADGTISITKSNVTSALGYTPPTSDTVYDNATTTTAGLMSASDKVKLNNIADNANNYIHPPTHPAGMITGLASVAKSGSYSDLSNKPKIPVVPTKVSAFINDAGYLTQHQSLDDYAKKSDISGMVKSVNNIKPDSNGNVAINVSGGGGVSTSESNTWTAEQIFNDVTISVDAGKINLIPNSTATPTTSYTIVSFDDSLLTLDFSALSAQARKDASKTIKFKIITSSFSSIQTLKIINAGQVIVPENTKLGGFINLLDGMMIFDGDNLITLFHAINMSQDGGNITS